MGNENLERAARSRAAERAVSHARSELHHAAMVYAHADEAPSLVRAAAELDSAALKFADAHRQHLGLPAVDMTDGDIRTVITLMNEAIEGGREEVVHPSTGVASPVRPLLRKLLDYGVARGAIKLPPCFKGGA